MRRPIFVLGALAACAISALVGFVLRSSVEPAKGAASNLEDERDHEMAKLQRDLRLLKGRVLSLSSKLDQTTLIEERATEDQKKEICDENKPKSERPAEEPGETEIRRRERLVEEKLEALHTQQKRDDEWASRTEDQVRRLFDSAEELKGSQILDLDCRDSLCRATVMSSNMSRKDAALSYISRAPPFMAGGFFRVSEDSTEENVETHVYFAREGHAMPRLYANVEEE